QFTYDPPCHKAKNKTQYKTIEYFYPFTSIDTAGSVLNRDRSSGKSGNQAVALTRRDPEHRCRHTVYNNRKQCCTQSDQRIVCICSKIHNITDRRSDGTVDLRHNKYAEEI